MDEEQINEAISMSLADLDHLKHIGKRVKDQNALTSKTLENINGKNYLSVGFSKSSSFAVS